MSAPRTCWDVLGISDSSSLSDITKAYRRLARQTHPDRFQAPAEKEKAKIAFQQLFCAYEEAKEQREESNKSPGVRTRAQKREAKKRKAGDAFNNVKQVFNDVCSEIKREREESVAKWKKDACDYILAAWPEEPMKCWTRFSFWEYQWSRSEFLELFRIQKPDLAKFLTGKLDELEKERTDKEATTVDDAVSKLKREWLKKDDEHGLERWMATSVPLSFYHRIAAKLPAGKKRRAVLKWYQKFDKETKEAAAARYATYATRDTSDDRAQAAADSIVAVYPDRAKIKSILLHLQHLWAKILVKLPKELQRTLEGMFCPSAKRLTGGMLTLEN